MSLKRSRKQMTKMSNSTKSADANAKMKTKESADQKNKKKVVRFKEEAPTSSTSIPSSTDCNHEDLWYTQSELSAQLEESKKPVAEWVANGYGVLVANSYLNPHVSVQEYLNAFAAICDPTSTSVAFVADDALEDYAEHDEDACSNDGGCMRGLESNLDADLKEERSRTRKQHVLAVLASQHSGADANGLYVTSRQSSSSAKLFAMRMGRADARWESSTTNDAEAAHEIVAEFLLQKQQQQQKDVGLRSRSSSITSSSSYDSLQSLLCMEPRCTSSTTFTTGTRLTSNLTLPVQEIVFGKFPQSLTA